MLTLLFFILTFAALGAMVWSGYQLLQPQENPLDDRLGELMATRRQAENRGSKRKLGGGFLNSFLYFLALVPGVDRPAGALDDWGRGKHTTTGACAVPVSVSAA